MFIGTSTQTTIANNTKPSSGTQKWVFAVATAPILLGLIFLISLAVWYKRRKESKKVIKSQ